MYDYLLLGSVGSPKAPLADEASDEDKGKVMEGFLRQGKGSGTHSNCHNHLRVLSMIVT